MDEPADLTECCRSFAIGRVTGHVVCQEGDMRVEGTLTALTYCLEGLGQRVQRLMTPRS